MTSIRCWQVDAFTNRAFGGNPAAVCWLDSEADPAWMQAVAAEMNLSETAFVRKLDDGLELRWFTPTVEVDLCGHATLATCHAIWSAGIVPTDEPLRFHTKSGLLTCRKNGKLIELDFPATPAAPATPPPGLLEAMGVRPIHVGKTKFDYLVVLDSPEAVQQARPDYAKLGEIPCRGVILTARTNGGEFDFYSRFFAPAVGVNEDPVCGSAHCCLTHYWAGELGKNELVAHQVSARGGILHLQLKGDRVILGGEAVTVWRGELL